MAKMEEMAQKPKEAIVAKEYSSLMKDCCGRGW
jgi:hypothetical protein